MSKGNKKNKKKNNVKVGIGTTELTYKVKPLTLEQLSNIIGEQMKEIEYKRFK